MGEASTGRSAEFYKVFPESPADGIDRPSTAFWVRGLLKSLCFGVSYQGIQIGTEGDSPTQNLMRELLEIGDPKDRFRALLTLIGKKEGLWEKIRDGKAGEDDRAEYLRLVILVEKIQHGELGTMNRNLFGVKNHWTKSNSPGLVD